MKRALVLGLLATLSLPGFSQEEKKLTAAEIFAKMVSAYANCETYRDICQTRNRDTSGRESKGTAKTVYKKGGIFRFEYRDTLLRDEITPNHLWTDMVIWSDGKEVKTKPDKFEELKKTFSEPDIRDLRFLLQIYSEMTLDTSMIVPLILYPKGNSKVPSFYFGQRGAVEGTEMVGPRQCYKLSLSVPATNSDDSKTLFRFYRFWIDNKSFLILRHQQEDVYSPDKKKTRTLDYQPEINVKLSPEELALDPAKK